MSKEIRKKVAAVALGATMAASSILPVVATTRNEEVRNQDKNNGDVIENVKGKTEPKTKAEAYENYVNAKAETEKSEKALKDYEEKEYNPKKQETDAAKEANVKAEENLAAKDAELTAKLDAEKKNAEDKLKEAEDALEKAKEAKKAADSKKAEAEKAVRDAQTGLDETKKKAEEELEKQNKAVKEAKADVEEKQAEFKKAKKHLEQIDYRRSTLAFFEYLSKNADTEGRRKDAAVAARVLKGEYVPGVVNKDYENYEEDKKSIFSHENSFIGRYGDATSIEKLKNGLEVIKRSNKLRDIENAEERYKGEDVLGPFKVASSAMAMSELMADFDSGLLGNGDYYSDYFNRFDYSYGSYCGEHVNPDIIDSWYKEGKDYHEAYLGMSRDYGEGNTYKTEEEAENAARDVYSYGYINRYLDLVSPFDTVVGAGVTYRQKDDQRPYYDREAGGIVGLLFISPYDLEDNGCIYIDAGYSVEEYEKLIENFEKTAISKSESDKARKAFEEAERKLEEAEKRLEEAEKKLEEIKNQKVPDASKTMDELKKEREELLKEKEKKEDIIKECQEEKEKVEGFIRDIDEQLADLKADYDEGSKNVREARKAVLTAYKEVEKTRTAFYKAITKLDKLSKADDPEIDAETLEEAKRKVEEAENEYKKAQETRKKSIEAHETAIKENSEKIDPYTELSSLASGLLTRTSGAEFKASETQEEIDKILEELEFIDKCMKEVEKADKKTEAENAYNTATENAEAEKAKIAEAEKLLNDAKDNYEAVKNITKEDLLSNGSEIQAVNVFVEAYKEAEKFLEEKRNAYLLAFAEFNENYVPEYEARKKQYESDKAKESIAKYVYDSFSGKGNEDTEKPYEKPDTETPEKEDPSEKPDTGTTEKEEPSEKPGTDTTDKEETSDKSDTENPEKDMPSETPVIETAETAESSEKSASVKAEASDKTKTPKTGDHMAIEAAVMGAAGIVSAAGAALSGRKRKEDR